MSPDPLLAQVQHAARYGKIIWRIHSNKRASERHVQARDVEEAIRTATKATDQPEAGTVRVEGGTDLDGDGLTVVVAFDPLGLRLITAF